MRYQVIFVLACVVLCAPLRAQENSSNPTNSSLPGAQAPAEIHVDEKCRISKIIPDLGGSKPVVYKDKKVCSVDSEKVSKRDVVENVGSQKKQRTVTIREHTFSLHNSSGQPVTFVVEQKVPKDWQVDSDPQPKELVGGVATFLVNAEPGQTVNLHVGERTPPAVTGEQIVQVEEQVEFAHPPNFVPAEPAKSLPMPRLKAGAEITPEKVRLSYVEGDVRFNRGDGKKPSLKKPWEQALVGLPVEQNYALSTGADGRAEIEFQTAGVLYLAQNSILEFNQLSVTDDVPTTRVRLISGTVTTDIEPIQGEVFVIAMSPGSYTVKYPEFDYTRVESYMGGMSFTPQVNAGSRFEQTHSAGDQALKLGETLVYGKGGASEVESVGKDKGPAGWDSWVAARCAERQEFTEASLRAPKLIPPSLDIAGLYAGPRLSQCEAHAVCCDRSVWSKPFEDAALQEAADRQAASKDAQRANTVSVKELQDESAGH